MEKLSDNDNIAVYEFRDISANPIQIKLSKNAHTFIVGCGGVLDGRRNGRGHRVFAQKYANVILSLATFTTITITTKTMSDGGSSRQCWEGGDTPTNCVRHVTRYSDKDGPQTAEETLVGRRGIHTIYVNTYMYAHTYVNVHILHKKRNMLKAPEQENERRQRRNQIKQIWNFTADEQENLLYICTYIQHTYVHVCTFICA